MNPSENAYPKGTIVWCRPTLADEPKQGKYIRAVTLEENKQGYRYGHIVEIEGQKVWCRLDLCSTDYNVVKSVTTGNCI